MLTLGANCATLLSTSRLDGTARASIVRLACTLELRPRPILALTLAPRLQYAFDPLLSFEQYAGGAYTIWRGYDPGVIAGDSGMGLSLEARLTSPTRGSLALQPYIFFDAATPGAAAPSRSRANGGRSPRPAVA